MSTGNAKVTVMLLLYWICVGELRYHKNEECRFFSLCF